MALLIFTLINTWRIIIRQKRYKTVYLLLFYIFTIVLCISRLNYILLIVYVLAEKQVFYEDVPCVCKLGIGMVHSVMLLELAFRVNQGIHELNTIRDVQTDLHLIRSRQKSFKEYVEKQERKLNAFKKVAYTIITLWILLLMIYLIFEGLIGEDQESKDVKN